MEPPTTVSASGNVGWKEFSAGETTARHQGRRADEHEPRAYSATAGAAATALAFQQRATPSLSIQAQPALPRRVGRILDPSFAKYRLFSSSVEQLQVGMRWGGGTGLVRRRAVIFGERHPNNVIMRYDEANGNWGVFAAASKFCQGHARDRQGA